MTTDTKRAFPKANYPPPPTPGRIGTDANGTPKPPFPVGTQARIVACDYAVRSPQPIVGTVGLVIECPVYRPTDEQKAFIWLRIDKPLSGLRDMDGGTWLLSPDDADDEDRNHFKQGYPPHLLEPADQPSSIAGYEEALIAAWPAERKRAVSAYFAACDSYNAEFHALMDEHAAAHDAGKAVGGNDWEGRYKDWRSRQEANAEAGFNGHIDWNNCRRAAGMETP